MITLEKVLQKAIEYNPRLNRDRVTKAYKYADKLHENQYRMSGDRYITHLLEVVDILLSLKPDEDTIIACFLHGVPHLPAYSLKDIKAKFGETVFFLLKALDNLYKVKARDQNTEAENIRKLFVTLAQDVRVILIKMADRLHNMETLSFRSMEKQKQIAKETLDVYVPISARLSIYSLKGQLEDKSFKYLFPNQYEHLKADLDDYLHERESTIEDSIKELRQFLEKNGIEGTVEGRVKNLYSVYRKLKVKNRSTLQDLYDVYAIRVVLSDKYINKKEVTYDHIYSVLGLIHSQWKPLGHRFKDYIAVPKPNGYRSLHTAVIGLSPTSLHPTEIQIRSKRMHEEAEYGIASHWLYDESKKKKRKGWEQKILDDHVDWVEALSAFQKDSPQDGGDLLDTLKLDVFSDRIFVMTPTGEVKDLPKGSTPVDFAYSVHTDIGHRCQLAKVNDIVVPLDYHLKNGEVVEIVLGKKQDPKPMWLSHVKTASAKTKIRSFLRSLDSESSFRKGKEKINKELARLGKPLLDENITILREYNGRRLSLRDREGLLEEIGNGSVLAPTIVKKIFREDVMRSERKARLLSKSRAGVSFPKGKTKSSGGDQVCIAGECGLPYRLGNCCKPRVGLPIVAYVTRGHAVTIHLQRCKLLRDAREERILEATWGKQLNDKQYSVKIQLRAKDRVGLIRDIADVITNMNINIRLFSDLRRSDDVIEREVVVEVANEAQLEQIMDRLERIRNIMEVKQAD